MASSNGKYMALSYCWGESSESSKLETTTSTIDRFNKGLPLEHVPKTIKGAMTITEKLGFHYLWVDRLCITQDNKADWQTEDRKMGRICSCNVYRMRTKNFSRMPHTLYIYPLRVFLRFITKPAR